MNKHKKQEILEKISCINVIYINTFQRKPKNRLIYTSMRNKMMFVNHKSSTGNHNKSYYYENNNKHKWKPKNQ